MLKYSYNFEGKFESIIIKLKRNELEKNFLIENAFGTDIFEHANDIQDTRKI